MMTRKKILPAFVLLAVLSFAGMYLAQNNPSPVARLVISPEGIELAPGESVQLSVTGYTKDGEAVSAEEVEKLDLRWEYEQADPIVTVDESGYLTAIRQGAANAWVTWDDGKKGARPITVTVSG